MEVLNAAGLTLVSVHKPTISSERRTEPRKLFSVPSTPPFKLPKPAVAAGGGIALLSAVLNGGGFADALTYEEALDQAMSSFPSSGSSDFDLGGLLDGFLKFANENPPVVAGGIALLAVPLVLAQILKKPKSWGVESAKNAFAKLSEQAGAELLDIRAPTEFRKVGRPDIRGFKKKVVSIAYKGDDKPGFLDKLSLKFKEPGNTTLYILDKFDGNSELVAELATVNGFKAAYAIKDGAEGPRGWMSSRLPWLAPSKALSIDFSNIKDTIDSLGEGTDALSVTLGLAAAAGLGALAFTEVETLLQVLGSVALVQFVTKKLLFAEDRKQTLKQVDEFVTTKVAPTKFLDEIKMIGKALLPPVKENSLLPAAAEGSQSTDTAASPIEKVDEIPAATPPKVEAATELPPINSVPKTEVNAQVTPAPQRPLSPYPWYPDFKPPASPSPSKP
ncbi:hypothetical protein AAC387_Pa10g0279 [Persea americana]